MIKQNVKSGRIAFYDPLTIRVATFWYPIPERADLDRFAKGLRKAGVPE